MRVFYRRVEVSGLTHLPTQGGVILCANHASALADAAILQTACSRTFHPLARSGLFESVLLRPLLDAVQAVPIYRRQDEGSDTSRNQDSFARCYELLRDGEALLIFPEGQSHSDPRLRPLKTGAARLALGARDANGAAPKVIPIGLTFSRKGKFRSTVLVQFGAPIELTAGSGDDEAAVRAMTAAIDQGLRKVTLNLSSWQEFEFLVELRRFFALRRGRLKRAGRGRLEARLRALQRLSEVHGALRERAPDRVEGLTRRLRRFQRLCRRFGVRDYQLTVRYEPALVARFVVRSVAFAIVVFPPALWGMLHSAIPLLLTSRLARRISRGSDQYETAKMLLGMLFLGIFWTAQTAVAAWRFGQSWAIVYGLSLPITAAIALAVAKERRRILENVRAFVLLARRRGLREYLLGKRAEIEIELTKLVRLAKRRDLARALEEATEPQEAGGSAA